MTECNRLPLVFSSLNRRKMVADFQGGDLTSDGGLPLLREVDRRIGLLDALSAAIRDPRDPDRIEHDQRTLLAQRILAIAAGYEDLNDHDALRTDTLLQALTDRRLKAGQKEGDPLASPPTLCRLENRITRQDLVRMADVLVDQYVASHPTPPEEIVLDFDATDDPVHGQQEGRFFHGYYDEYCFLPLYVFAGDQLLAAYLRPSNIDGAKHSRAILKLLVTRLRQAWPQVKIVFRADSGFCRWRMMRWCDRHGVDYLVGLARNAVLERLGQGLMDQAQAGHEATGEKQRLFGEFSYAADTWDRERRVISKAEFGPQGDNPRFVVTSLAGDSIGKSRMKTGASSFGSTATPNSWLISRPRPALGSGSTPRFASSRSSAAASAVRRSTPTCSRNSSTNCTRRHGGVRSTGRPRVSTVRVPVTSRTTCSTISCVHSSTSW